MTEPTASVRVVRAAADDAPRLAPLFDAYRVFYRQPSDIPAAEAFVRQRLHAGQSVVFLALAEADAPAGFAQLYPSFTSVGLRPVFILNDLYVDARCRRRGVARALIDACVAHGRSTGARNLILLTEHANTPARTLYERLGWTLDTTYVRYTFGLDPPSDKR